jgi:hypothetical protein
MTVETVVNSRRGTITSGGTGGLLGRGTVLPIGMGRAHALQASSRRSGADVIWLYPPAPVVDAASRATLRFAPMEA